MSRRIEQINALLQRELSKILSEQIEFEPGVLATIMRVETTADLGHAKIFLSVIPFEKRKETFGKIKQSLRDIQNAVFSRLAMNPVPQLHFIIDEAEEEAEHIEDLLDKIKKKV